MTLWLAFVLTLLLSLLWLRSIDFLAIRGIISQKISRKIIHIGTGPIFVLCWLLFPEVPEARFFAAVIPFLITVQFFLIGIGVIKDQASVEAMARNGDPKEILKGPLFYGIVFVLLTIVYWVDSPIGIIALMVLSGGDGFADIIGRRIPSPKLKWSPNKSLAGSLAMFVGGTFFSLAVIFILSQQSLLAVNFFNLLPKIILINVLATFIESLPLQDWDNITVPLSVVLMSLLII